MEQRIAKGKAVITKLEPLGIPSSSSSDGAVNKRKQGGSFPKGKKVIFGANTVPPALPASGSADGKYRLGNVSECVLESIRVLLKFCPAFYLKRKKLFTLLIVTNYYCLPLDYYL